MTLQELQKKQASVDDITLQIKEGFPKLRHTALHLAKSLGKLATYCERQDHDDQSCLPDTVTDEVVPDLLIYATQIANYFQVDLQAKYDQRTQHNIARSKKHHPVSDR